jgi:hypothetical protein
MPSGLGAQMCMDRLVPGRTDPVAVEKRWDLGSSGLEHNAGVGTCGLKHNARVRSITQGSGA